MNQPKVTLETCRSRERCAPAMEQVLTLWSSDATSELSEEIQEHLLGCCRCLRVWIALEAATELATRDGSRSNVAK